MDPPIGYHTSTADFISNFKLQSASSIYKNFPITPTVIKHQPKGVDTIKWQYNTKPPKQFLATIPFGRVWGTNGSVIAPDNKLLWDVSFEYNTFPQTHPIFKQKYLSPITFANEDLAVLTFQVSFNYFHWMFDVLPRLDLLRKSKSKYDRLIINRGSEYQEDTCKFQDESLELLGIPKDRLIECDEQTHIQAKKLIVSSSAGYTAHVPKHVCQFIREEFLVNDNIQKLNGYERIIVSREDSLHRKVLNEKEVIEVLKKYGFKLVTLSAMSLGEQIQLFNSADVIVSPHGAGLTNLVFCNPGTKVIELFTPTYLLPSFYIISNHMDLDYYYLIGKEVPPDQTRSNHKDPIVIDLDKLQRTLNLAKIK